MLLLFFEILLTRISCHLNEKTTPRTAAWNQRTVKGPKASGDKTLATVTFLIFITTMPQIMRKKNNKGGIVQRQGFERMESTFLKP